jgi:phage terminase large subunit GpA-like protein
LQLWHLDTDYFKTWLYSRFDWPVDQPGGFHLPVEATDDYCQQITAEAKKVSDSGAVEWVRVRKANHYLDCEVLNIAAAHILGVHLLRNETPKEPSPEVPPPSFRAPQRKVQMPKQSYVKRGRY